MSERNMVATKLLMENDKVRIWEMRLQPGERGELHKHPVAGPPVFAGLDYTEGEQRQCAGEAQHARPVEPGRIRISGLV